MRNTVTLGSLVLLSFVSLPVDLTRAAIIANFDGDNGNASVDQYVGTPGDGWVSAWSVRVGASGSGSTSSPTVVNTNPLNGGDKYLSVPFGVGTNTNDNYAAVVRQFGTFGDVSPTLPYIVSFDYRPEAKNTLAGAEFRSRFQIFGSSSLPNGDTSNDATWVIVAAAGTSGSAPTGVVANTWGFLNNSTSSTASFTAMNFVSSGIAMNANTVYHFDIAVDPVNKQYTPTISDGITTFTSPTPLGFRNKAASATSASYLAFGARQNSSTGSIGLTSYPFSIDSIAIVPEPSSLLLIGIAGIGLVGFVRRRCAK